jgi:hypothetical protein
MNIAMKSPIRRAGSRCSGRQLVHQDGDENDVVDAQHQLQCDQDAQGNPGLRIGQ